MIRVYFRIEANKNIKESFVECKGCVELCYLQSYKMNPNYLEYANVLFDCLFKKPTDQ